MNTSRSRQKRLKQTSTVFGEVQCLMCNANTAIQLRNESTEGAGLHSWGSLAASPALYSAVQKPEPGCTLEVMNVWNRWNWNYRNSKTWKWGRERKERNEVQPTKPEPSTDRTFNLHPKCCLFGLLFNCNYSFSSQRSSRNWFPCTRPHLTIIYFVEEAQ